MERYQKDDTSLSHFQLLSQQLLPFPVRSASQAVCSVPKAGAISGKTQAIWLSHHLFSTSRAILSLTSIGTAPEESSEKYAPFYG